MDGIDSHHLVCAWLNISPVTDSLSSASSPAPPSSSDVPNQPHYHRHHHNDDDHQQPKSHPAFLDHFTSAVRHAYPVAPYYPGHVFSSFSSAAEGGVMGDGRSAGNGGQQPPAISPLSLRPSAPESTPPPILPERTDGPNFLPTLSAQPVDQQTYSANLESVFARPAKRQRASHSRSANSAVSTSTSPAIPSPSETRAKRRALEILIPSTQFGTTVRPAIFPPHVRGFLRHFAASEFEQGCLPFCTEVESILDAGFSHEIFPSYAYREIHPSDYPHAVAFLNFAIRIHNFCIHNSIKALDEASWHPCVRSLLSVERPCTPSAVPTVPPPHPQEPSQMDLFLTLDATTKATRKSVLPTYPNIKLDQLLLFNADHALLRPIALSIRARGLVINAFADSSIDDVPIALGVEVKAPGGSEGPIAAEYQLTVWAAKTLTVSNLLTVVPRSAACDIAVGLSVCGHVWAMHVTYWSPLGTFVTHGPVIIGSTDTLYGTMKIVAWVVRFKEWAADRLLPDWIERVAQGTVGGGD